MIRLLFLLLTMVLWSCDNKPIVAPSPSAEIVVFWPLVDSKYLIDDIVRIKWAASKEVGPVDIALRPADSDLPQWLLFDRVTGGEVVWRNWWERHEAIVTGHYVIMIGTPNRQPFVNVISAVFFLERS